jgi:hypothetical protein
MRLACLGFSLYGSCKSDVVSPIKPAQ